MKRIQTQPVASCAYIVSTPSKSAPQFWATTSFTYPRDHGSAERYTSPAQAAALALTLLNDPGHALTLDQGACLCRYSFDDHTVEPIVTLLGNPSPEQRLAMDLEWRTAFGEPFPANLQEAPAGDAYLISCDAGTYWSGDYWSAPQDATRALRLGSPLEAFQLARRLKDEHVDYLEGSPVFLARIDLETDDVHRLFSTRLDSNRPKLREVWRRQFGEPLPEVEIFGSAVTPFGLHAESIPKFYERSGCMKMLADGESTEGKTLFVHASVAETLLEEREELRRLLDASTQRLRELEVSPAPDLDTQGHVRKALDDLAKANGDAERSLALHKAERSDVETASPTASAAMDLPDIHFEF
ncbi:hypothetical protein [Geopseudomonas aromaticivorans]